MNRPSSQGVRRAAEEYGVQVIVLVVVTVALLVVSPQFRGSSAVFATLEGFPLVGVVALGLACTMIAGEIDLSVASIASCASVLAVRMSSMGLVPTVIIVVALSAAFGAVQGLLIAWLRINSIVFTVGTLVLVQGLAWIFSNEGPIQLTNFGISDQLIVRWGIFSPSSVVAIVFFLLVALMLWRTRPGREIYAVGGGRREALAAGVRLRRPIVCAFATSGAAAGIAGGLAAIRGGSAAPNSFTTLLLTGIAAALIGGISLAGGRGGAGHVVIGVLVMSVLSAGLAARGSADYVVSLVSGVVLIVTVGLRAGVQSAAAAHRRNARARQIVAESQPSDLVAQH